MIDLRCKIGRLAGDRCHVSRHDRDLIERNGFASHCQRDETLAADAADYETPVFVADRPGVGASAWRPH
jgi:hypothetical protein